MKKLYIQPQTDAAELMPTTIICASTGEGDPVPVGAPVYGG